MTPSSPPLLSIVIPAYDRPDQLRFGLYRFITQILGRYEDEVEIIICDDATPGDRLAGIRDIASKYRFVRFHRNQVNLGLEANLIASTAQASGEYLWVFGDDDFLDRRKALANLLLYLRSRSHDVCVLNRTRRSRDLASLLSDNWMSLDPGRSFAYAGLRPFCLDHGFISVIGFISVCVFKREPFVAVEPTPYVGTMYPQLGALLQAFHSRPVLLIGDPLVCHRTLTSNEKRTALGTKSTEAAFMSDVAIRNATYFSHPYIAMLDRLIGLGALSPHDVASIREHTVINGLLVDFLIDSVALHRHLGLEATDEEWDRTRRFFDRVPLTPGQRVKIDPLLPTAVSPAGGVAGRSEARADWGVRPLTISVITPSYNQGPFLERCLASVRDQTYAPIEHLVFDPGSADESRAIAGAFPHVTLVGEPDSGQSDAVNKGFQRATGDIIAWVNSDDLFADPGVFARVIARFDAPDAPDVVYGRGVYIDEHDNVLRDVYVNRDPSSLSHRFHHEDGILQPALFMRRSVIDRVGLLRTDRHYTMDYEYWIHCVERGVTFAFIDANLALARYHRSNKTYGMRGNSYAEICAMMHEHFGYVHHVWLRRYAEFLAEGHDGVLANAATSGIGDQQAFDVQYRRLLAAYDGGHDVAELLLRRQCESGYGDTRNELERVDLAERVPCKEIPLDQATEPGHVCYTVGPRRWAFDAAWKRAEIDRCHEFLRQRIDARETDTCVIVGNGPSLNRSDLSLLEGHDVIISNNAFLDSDLQRHATLFTVVNYLVAEQSRSQIHLLQGPEKIVPYWMAYCLDPGPDVHFVDAVGHAAFSTDIFTNMSWRHTVSFFNLHLAYGLGYRRVVLIGFDHSYQQDSAAVEQDILHSYADDVNHFSQDYFRGKRWQAADVLMMEKMYCLAKDAYEEDGRVIINATEGGKLELFQRQELSQALR